MPHLLVVDLESTCWEDEPVRQSVDTMEIIEFGCVVCSWKGKVITAFSQLARPVERPELTPFCRTLTGITQDMVDQAPSYEEAVRSVDSQLAEFDATCWLSWGDYDRNHLAAMARRTGVAPDFLSLPHINLRKAYQRFRGKNRRAHVHGALEHFGLKWEGVQHRALPDAFNNARLIPHLTDVLLTMLGEQESK